MPSRRRYLAALASGAGVIAGCVDGTSSDDSNDSEGTRSADGVADDGSQQNASDGTTSDDTTDDDRDGSGNAGADDPDVVVRDLGVHKAVQSYQWPGSTQVLAPTDEQFVVLKVGSDTDVERENFELVADGESWEPIWPFGETGATRTIAGLEAMDAPTTDEPFFLLFRIPSPLDAEQYAVECDSATVGDVPLTDDRRSRLARPDPSFELRSFDVPESVDFEAEMEIEIEVENVSDTDGRFLGAAYWPHAPPDADRAEIVSEHVDGGERFTAGLEMVAFVPPCEVAPGEHEVVRASLDGYVEAERSVRVDQTDETYPEYCE